MKEDLIDVCLVTKNRPSEEWIDKLKYIPLHNLIVETSKPLALARMKAMQKVETKWFAFIDDDIEITSSWFASLFSRLESNVGAIQGIPLTKGLGEKWDRALNKTPEKIRELKKGERGYTHNTLIRTELVKDWKPSRNDLSAWEDYEITQHILRKRFKWLVIPVQAYHIKSWKKLRLNAIWSMHNWKKLHPSRLEIAKKILRLLVLIFAHFSTFPQNWRLKAYQIRQYVIAIWGLIR